MPGPPRHRREHTAPWRSRRTRGVKGGDRPPARGLWVSEQRQQQQRGQL